MRINQKVHKTHRRPLSEGNKSLTLYFAFNRKKRETTANNEIYTGRKLSGKVLKLSMKGKNLKGNGSEGLLMSWISNPCWKCHSSLTSLALLHLLNIYSFLQVSLFKQRTSPCLTDLPDREQLFKEFKAFMKVFAGCFHHRKQMWNTKMGDFIHVRIHVDFEWPEEIEKKLTGLKKILFFFF